MPAPNDDPDGDLSTREIVSTRTFGAPRARVLEADARPRRRRRPEPEPERIVAEHPADVRGARFTS
jgi:hypothetical protein